MCCLPAWRCSHIAPTYILNPHARTATHNPLFAPPTPSVLVHLLPGLALFAHRFLSHTAQPLMLGRDLLTAAAEETANAGARSPSGACTSTSSGNSGVSSMSAAAVSIGHWMEAVTGVATGRMPCPGDTAAYGSGSGAGATRSGGGGGGGLPKCYAGPAGPAAAPVPAALWLVAAPLGFYAAWQLGYFLLVQVACRRVIVEGGYDTSYRWEERGEGSAACLGCRLCIDGA